MDPELKLDDVREIYEHNLSLLENADIGRVVRHSELKEPDQRDLWWIGATYDAMQTFHRHISEHPRSGRHEAVVNLSAELAEGISASNVAFEAWQGYRPTKRERVWGFGGHKEKRRQGLEDNLREVLAFPIHFLALTAMRGYTPEFSALLEDTEQVMVRNSQYHDTTCPHPIPEMRAPMLPYEREEMLPIIPLADVIWPIAQGFRDLAIKAEVALLTARDYNIRTAVGDF
jgi:hypothetical protein